jgi:Na+/melibiose symporter-like transporter
MAELPTSDHAIAAAPRLLGRRELFLLSCYWFAFNFQWGAILAVILPSQIAMLVGAHRKELFNGTIPPLGAIVSMAVSPLAGAWSDAQRSRFGRRRPFLLVGSLVNVAGLLALAPMGAGDRLRNFVLAYLGVQLGSNFAAGPYSGLIPDVVPPSQRGTASGWMALMSALGTMMGALTAGQLIHNGNYQRIYVTIAVVVLVFLVLTLVGVREQPWAEPPPHEDWRQFLRSFVPDPRRHRDFYWVMITRALVTMGIYSVFTFFQFFLADVVRVQKPEAQASYLVGIIILTGVMTSLVAGMLSDRVGRKPLVYWSGGVMAAAAVIFIPVAFYPSLQFTYVIGALFGLGWGAFQAVDWALAIDVLPHQGGAAKDMGIWHTALVLPQIIAPALTGITLSTLKAQSLLLGYTTVFVMTAAWFVLGTVFVRRIRGAR